MKMLKLPLILSFLTLTLAPAALAQNKQRRPRQRPPPEVSAESSVQAAPVARSRTHSSSVGVGMVTWHETVELQQAGNTAKMYAQLKAVTFSFDFNQLRPLSRWHWSYGIDLGVGTLKGKGTSPITDQFNDQPFLMATARWGLVFRASPAARAGFFIPASYRQIQWAYDSSSTTKAGDAQLSAGIGGVFQLRFTPRTSFQTTLLHQHMWSANIWGAALNFEL